MRIRHIIKSITWRICGTIDTFVLAIIFTNNAEIGTKIAVSEIFTKILLYYLHERVWIKIKFSNSKLRHLSKTFTWRILGTLDTILLSILFTNNFTIGLSIGGLELLTKMILYYIHERVWYKSRFGIKNT